MRSRPRWAELALAFVLAGCASEAGETGDAGNDDGSTMPTGTLAPPPSSEVATSSTAAGTTGTDSASSTAPGTTAAATTSATVDLSTRAPLEELARIDGFLVAMAFQGDALLFTEKTGTVYRLAPGATELEAWLRIDDVRAGGEQGLLGIAVDPTDPTGVTVFVTQGQGDGRVNRVLRYTDTGTGLDPESVVTLLEIPREGDDLECTNHNGGNIHYGPDGYLYVTVGEYGCTQEHAQDLESLKGKMLRIDPLTGAAAPDNPLGNEIWAYGLRNAFDFTFDTVTGSLWATENGPGCNDELDIVAAGQNYGWPEQRCADTPGVAPIWIWENPVALTGIAIYDGPALPEGAGASALVCDYNTGSLRVLPMDTGRAGVIDEAAYLPGGQHCFTDILAAPDGSILFLDAGPESSVLWRLNSAAAWGEPTGQ